MSARPRPVVKHQYGSKASLNNNHTSSSSSSSANITTSSSPYASSFARKRFQSCLMSSDDEDDTIPRSRSKQSQLIGGKGFSTPPTSSCSSPVKADQSTTRRSPRSHQTKDKEKSQPVNSIASAVEASSSKAVIEKGKSKSRPAGDLRSFFVEVSPKRIKTTPLAITRKSSKSKASPASTSKRSLFGTVRNETASSSSSGVKPKVKLEQLYLDLFTSTKLDHSTLSCSICGLSYARTPDDMALHDKHHKRVVGGVEWISSVAENTLIGTGELIVLEQGTEGHYLLLDPGVVFSGTSVMGRKVKEVLETIDRELSATALSDDQLREGCKLVLVISGHGRTKGMRKVVAACLVQRIKEAHQVVIKEGESESAESVGKAIEFSSGDDQGGAIFCDPQPVRALLGVHRIWTCSTSRRHGHALKMLDHMALRCIYGAAVTQERRRYDVAFSQPTGMGQALAKRWTGTPAFRVFVD